VQQQEVKELGEALDERRWRKEKGGGEEKVIRGDVSVE
jgi:hypothetical protein